MLNFELARIVVEERRRRTDENLRQAGFRRALGDRVAAPTAQVHGPAESGQACTEKGQRAKPALG
jgi:hypothetical protein